MSALIYLHGFLSSPLSAKAQQTEAWLKVHRPDITYYCPALSARPGDALRTIEQLVQGLPQSEIGLVGSSLGGFWSTWVVEQLGVPAVLVNPAVRPQERFAEFVGQTLRNYHSGEEFYLHPEDLDDLVQADVAQLRDPSRYWVMLQTGDETLDYRQALEKYRGARVLLEEGGNHSFEGFEQWLPDIVAFLFGRT